MRLLVWHAALFALSFATPVAEQSPSAVTGVVRGQDGRPVASASVLAYPDDVGAAIGFAPAPADAAGARRATTNEAGRFTLAVDPSSPSLHVVAAAMGHSAALAEDVAPGDDLTITLDAPRALHGVVTDIDGRAIAGARVRWLALLGACRIEREAVSDASGAYRVADLPSIAALARAESADQWWIDVRADSFAPLFVDTPFGHRDEPGDLRRDLVLVRGATIAGWVVDAESRAPIPNARVAFWSQEGWGSWRRKGGFSILNPYTQRPLAETRSSADGSFEFVHVPARGFHAPASGGNFVVGEVGASAAGFAVGTTDVRLVDDGEKIEIEVRCWPSATVAGRVVDEAGKGVSGIRVWTYSRRLPTWEFPRTLEDRPPSDAVTDPTGAYVLDGIAALRAEEVEAEIHASVPGSSVKHSVAATVRAGRTATAGDIEIAPDPAVTVLVTDATGAPVPGAFAGAGTYAPIARNRTGSDGRVRLIIGRPGATSAQVCVRARGFATTITTVTRSSGDSPTEARVALARGQSIRGRVLGHDGAPVRGARVWIPRIAFFGTDQTPYEAAMTREDGSFEVRGLPEDAYPVSIVCFFPPLTEHGVARRIDAPTRVVATGAAEEAVFRLPPPEWATHPRFEGTVTAAATGKPIAVASATLRNDSTLLSAVRTRRGGFEFPSVAPGGWRLRVSAPGYATEVRRGLVFEAGVAPPPLRVALEKGVTVRGTIQAPPGTDLLGATLYVSSEDDLACHVERSGRFTLRGLRPGRHLIEVFRVVGMFDDGPGNLRLAANPPVIDVPEGEAEIERTVMAVKPSSIKISRMGAAPADVRVELSDEAGQVLAAWPGPFSNGWYRNVFLPSGRYEVRITAAGLEPDVRDVTLDEGKHVTMKF